MNIKNIWQSEEVADFSTVFKPKQFLTEWVRDYSTKLQPKEKGALYVSADSVKNIELAVFSEDTEVAIKSGFFYLPGKDGGFEVGFDPNFFFLIVCLAIMRSLSKFSVKEASPSEVLLVENWAKFLDFAVINQGVAGFSALRVANFSGICKDLEDSFLAVLENDYPVQSIEPVLLASTSVFNQGEALKGIGDLPKIAVDPLFLAQALSGNALTQELKSEEFRAELTTKTIAALGYNGLLVGPPGTGKTWAVQRAVELPTIQVSLEGSTEPETVVANIAQNQEGKFQAFLAETGKALKLAMLLAIVHCLREKNVLKKIGFKAETSEKGNLLAGLPASLQALLPQKKFAGFTSDFTFLIENLHSALLQNEENTVKQWLAILDAYADPFALDRWQEALNLYQQLGANKVGTTVIMSVEEIYHAVENRKILDLLINLMAGQKKLPLTKAGVVGGDLYGHNVSFWATGNPLRDAYLPEALSSRFGYQQFVGYPDSNEEKRRMELAVKAVNQPEDMKLNLLSTELADYWNIQPLQKPEVAPVKKTVRNKIYKIVNWTREQFNQGNLRSCACPRMASFWEVLVSAFTAQNIPETEAMLLALEATGIALVDLDEQARPDPAQTANLRQYADSVMSSN